MDDDECEQEAQRDDSTSEAEAALQRALEENRRRSEAMVNAQLTNPNPSR